MKIPKKSNNNKPDSSFIPDHRVNPTLGGNESIKSNVHLFKDIRCQSNFYLSPLKSILLRTGQADYVVNIALFLE